jgi:hypothetical protein
LQFLPNKRWLANAKCGWLAFDRWRINDLKRELDAIGCNVDIPMSSELRISRPRY